MTQYRKRPNLVEAFQVTTETKYNQATWPVWLKEARALRPGVRGSVYDDKIDPGKGRWWLGRMLDETPVYLDSWLIREADGSLSVCDPQTFARDYEAWVTDAYADDKLDLQIDRCELDARAANCLKWAKIYTLRDLVSRSEQEVRQLRNCGPVTARHIRSMLQSRGLDFRQKLPAPATQEPEEDPSIAAAREHERERRQFYQLLLMAGGHSTQPSRERLQELVTNTLDSLPDPTPADLLAAHEMQYFIQQLVERIREQAITALRRQLDQFRSQGESA